MRMSLFYVYLEKFTHNLAPGKSLDVGTRQIGKDEEEDTDDRPQALRLEHTSAL